MQYTRSKFTLQQGFRRLFSLRHLVILTPPPLGPKSCYPSPPPSGPKKFQNIQCLRAKEFSGAKGAGKYPYIPKFLFFVAVLRNNFSRNISKGCDAALLLRRAVNLASASTAKQQFLDFCETKFFQLDRVLARPSFSSTEFWLDRVLARPSFGQTEFQFDRV